LQYEALYVKKGKDAIDPEADMEGESGMPSMGGHKKNLSVEIPGDPSMMQMQLGELNTPNSMALFNQLGNSLLPVILSSLILNLES